MSKYTETLMLENKKFGCLFHNNRMTRKNSALHENNTVYIANVKCLSLWQRQNTTFCVSPFIY